MAGSFKMTREKKGSGEVIRMSGAITGDSGLQFMTLYDGVPRQAIFNFRDVDNINSQGLQAWMLFLRDFLNDHDVSIEECPPVIVSQMNMLPSFTLKTKVLSIYVAYFCPACNKTQNRLMEAKQFPKDEDDIKLPSCQTCKGPTELDDPDYFLFLTR